MKVEKTDFYSLRAGKLAAGCKHCVKGEKLVLFVTGLCSARCDFCPVSDRKLYKDVIYANERPLKNKNETNAIIEEARVCSAKGAGITGGDPLMTLKRTARYIKLLKKTFGSKFHIHLYTPLNLVDEQKLKQLFHAGLDEIRFHADINKPELWNRILIAKKFNWDIGVEIPVFPGKEEKTKKLIDFLDNKVDFLNLNELELADNKVWKQKTDVKCKDNTSYAIMGSDVSAKKIIAYAAKKNIRTHYCTCKLKDKVQLANRIKRRAINVKQSFDRITGDGMLLRGAIYLPELVPGFGYHERINNISTSQKKKALNSLKMIRKAMLRQGLGARDVLLDDNKLRLITSQAIAKSFDIAGTKRAIVKEYPTFDALELEVEFMD